MGVRVLYHDDFDGAASAAIAAAVIKELGINQLTFVPVDHHLRPEWLTPAPAAFGDEPVVLVDFLYHPAATMWFDHHRTSFLTQAFHQNWQDRVAGEQAAWKFWPRRVGEPTSLLVWDPTASSCARLIYNSLLGIWSDAQRFGPLADAADVIDQAQYTSATQYFEGVEPHIAIEHAWRALHTGQKDAVIRALMTGSLEAARDTVIEEARQAQARMQATLGQYDRCLEFDRGVVVVDTVMHDLPFLRFAPYYFHPNALYSLSLYKDGDGVLRVSLGKNPWIDFEPVDLSQLAAEVGGGGHRYAAGASFDSPGDYQRARTWIHQAAIRLR